jgi:hypothetical protein
MDDYTRYLSSLLAGLSIQAANGSKKAELKRTSQMALRHLGYGGLQEEILGLNSSVRPP